MNVQHCIKSALALLAFSAGSAMAISLTLQSSDIPAHLDKGSYKGTFDGSALLPAGAIINSLQFSFVFIDDGDTVVYTTGQSTSTNPVTVRETVNSKTYKETITKSVTSPRSGAGEQESVTLSFGELTLSGATTPVYENVVIPTAKSTFTQVLYLKNDTNIGCTQAQWLAGTANCQQVTRTTVTNYQTSIVSTDYTGQITFEGSLMAYGSLLGNLSLGGILGFSLDVLGDIDLAGASLDIDYDLPPVKVIVDVPEPASLPLFGIAMLGMAGLRRRKRA